MNFEKCLLYKTTRSAPGPAKCFQSSTSDRNHKNRILTMSERHEPSVCLFLTLAVQFQGFFPSKLGQESRRDINQTWIGLIGLMHRSMSRDRYRRDQESRRPATKESHDTAAATAQTRRVGNKDTDLFPDKMHHRLGGEVAEHNDRITEPYICSNERDCFAILSSF